MYLDFQNYLEFKLILSVNTLLISSVQVENLNITAN